MRQFLSISLVILICANFLFADFNTKQEKQAEGVHTELHIRLDFKAATYTSNFFDIYQDLFEGVKNRFDETPAVFVGTKVYINKQFRAGAFGGVSQTNLSDSYYRENDGIARSYNQDIKIRNLPIYGIFEYVPYYTQFKSYLGAGFGININNVYWEENIGSSLKGDLRVGGINYEQTHITPMITFQTGMELGFDKFGKRSFLGGVIFEVKYQYTFRKLDIFHKVKDQFSPVIPDELNSAYSMGAGYICLSVGVCFNYYHTGLSK